MLLSKIMNDQPADVTAIVAGKLALKYSSRQVDAIKAVAKAYKERSLQEFEKVVKVEYSEEIQEDLVVSHKLKELSDKLLEQNLQRLLEPFERVQIAHIAELIHLPVNEVQKKLGASFFSLFPHNRTLQTKTLAKVIPNDFRPQI